MLLSEIFDFILGREVRVTPEEGILSSIDIAIFLTFQKKRILFDFLKKRLGSLSEKIFFDKISPKLWGDFGSTI